MIEEKKEDEITLKINPRLVGTLLLVAFVAFSLWQTSSLMRAAKERTGSIIGLSK